MYIFQGELHYKATKKVKGEKDTVFTGKVGGQVNADNKEEAKKKSKESWKELKKWLMSTSELKAMDKLELVKVVIFDNV